MKAKSNKVLLNIKNSVYAKIKAFVNTSR